MGHQHFLKLNATSWLLINVMGSQLYSVYTILKREKMLRLFGGKSLIIVTPPHHKNICKSIKCKTS